MTKPSSKSRRPKPTRVTRDLVSDVRQRLLANKRVRRTLPNGGRLHIDRQLPFLCVYRAPQHQDVGTSRFVVGEASYLVTQSDSISRTGVGTLLREVVSSLVSIFGAFMIVEVWADVDRGKASDPAVPTVPPTFQIHAPQNAPLNRTVETLAKYLRKVKVLKQQAEVEVQWDGKATPPDMRPLLSAKEAAALHCVTVGIAIPPVYRKANTKKEYPLIARSLRRSLGLALRHALFEFSRTQTTHRPKHYHQLGRRAVVKTVWDIDQRLGGVSSSFDYLLQLTPVNCSAAFKQFKRDNFERSPEFHYRPQQINPSLLLRQLYDIPIERVEDPALQRLFLEKQDELGLKINMLRDRDTRRFLYESLQLFGEVDDNLLQLAKDMLNCLSMKRAGAKKNNVNAEEFCRIAAEECEYYRQLCPGFAGEPRIVPDIAGLLVSRGKLLIDADLNMPRSRVNALLAHEVGTHLLTYYNGKTQPFRQLYSGLAGYEELQEGLAVVAEWLVGGLSQARMRQLAARVIAVRNMTDGATFVDTFRILDRYYEFSHKQAYSITMRVYRGGGFTKDAIYLRGLRELVRYIKDGGDLAPLFIGKMAVRHIPIVKELQYRKVLSAAPALPRYLGTAEAQQRLESLRASDGSLLHLVNEELSPRSFAH